MNNLKGLVPVLITPLDQNHKVDTDSIERLIDHHLEASPAGFWVLGTGGEDMGLSFSQRITVAQNVCEYVGGNLPIYLGCSFFSVQDSKAFIKETSGLKFKSYHAMPYHPKVSSSMIIRWYKIISDLTEGNLWAYTSGNWAQHISPGLIKRLRDDNLIKGVKFSSSNMVDVAEALSLKNEKFDVITAVIKTLYSSLCLGATAATSVEAVYAQDEINLVLKKFEDGDLIGALKEQKKLNAVLRYPVLASPDNFLRIAELKYMLSKKDICQEYVTEYYRTLEDNEKKILDDFLHSKNKSL